MWKPVGGGTALSRWICPTQSFLAVFRSLAMVEKTVERCCISLNGRNSRLVVQLHCRYGERAAGWPRGPWGGG